MFYKIKCSYSTARVCTNNVSYILANKTEVDCKGFHIQYNLNTFHPIRYSYPLFVNGICLLVNVLIFNLKKQIINNSLPQNKPSLGPTYHVLFCELVFVKCFEPLGLGNFGLLYIKNNCSDMTNSETLRTID